MKKRGFYGVWGEGFMGSDCRPYRGTVRENEISVNNGFTEDDVEVILALNIAEAHTIIDEDGYQSVCSFVRVR